MKNIRFHRAVEREIENWPLAVKIEMADLFGLISAGKIIGMPASRPMPSVSIGVSELRIKERSGQYRVFYFTKHADFILVFHAFKKKTQATPKYELVLGRKRLEDLL
jgi:phage-related protein